MREYPNTVDEYEAQTIARAEYFTACQFLGAGQYDRRECPDLDAAKETGLAMKKANPRTVMIYAVTPEGRSVHVCNV